MGSRLSVVRLVSTIGVLLVVLVLASTLLLLDRQWDDYRLAQAELAGLEPAAALLKLASLSAEHRGLSAGLLSGDQQFRIRRESKEVDVTQALDKALEATRIWNTPRISSLRGELREGWQALGVALVDGRLREEDSFQRHSALIQRQLELLDEVVNASNLAFDREPSVRTLAVLAFQRQPLLCECVGQLRGHGTAMLAGSGFDPVERTLMALTLESCRQMFATETILVQRAETVAAATLAALASPQERASSSFARASALVETTLLQADVPRAPGTEYFATLTQAIDAQTELGDVTLALLRGEMRTLAAAAGGALTVTAIVGATLFLVSCWLVWSIVIGVAKDVSERERAEGAGRASEARYRTLFDCVPDGIVVADAQSYYLDANASMCRMLGYSRDEFIGLHASDIVSAAEAAHIEPALTTIKATSDYHREWQFRRKDGSVFAAEVIASMMPDGHLLGMVRDISERRVLEQQLRQSHRMESIGQLTGGLAHDFNNLLGVIVGNLDLLERHVAGNDKAIARVQTALRAAMRGADLTTRLLAFARRQQLNPQPTQINAVIAELIEMLPRTLGPDIEIRTTLAQQLPSATVDASGLESALLNLALNARDAMPGSGRLTIATDLVHLDRAYAAVQTGEVEPGSYVRISVSDTGHGMSQDTMGKVFEPFFTTKARGKGTGLGLAMVYGFVKQSRGNISIYSEVGVGTTFTIYLPLADAGLPVMPVHGVAERPKPLAGRLQGTILIVDDEVDLLEIAVSYCEELGLRVLRATDGPSALEVASKEPKIDLLLTDVVMPGGMNGMVVAEQLRARYPNLRVAYCSGFPSSALAERSQLRVDGPLINKPYLKSAFVQTVADAITGAPTSSKDHAA